MIIVETESPVKHPTAHFPTRKNQACIRAHGDPHRRTWVIEVAWNYRDGIVQGRGKFEDKWLSGALWQIQVLEKNILNRPSGSNWQDIEIRIQCPPELMYSVLRTATRYNIKFTTERLS